MAITDHANNKVGESRSAVTTAEEIAVKISCSKRGTRRYERYCDVHQVCYRGDVVLTRMAQEILMNSTTLQRHKFHEWKGEKSQVHCGMAYPCRLPENRYFEATGVSTSQASILNYFRLFEIISQPSFHLVVIN